MGKLTKREKLQNEMRQIIYSLHRAKEITQTVYDNITNSVKFEMSYKNNKFKISAPTWNKEFELLDGSYPISDIQDYFEYIFKKTWDSYW